MDIIMYPTEVNEGIIIRRSVIISVNLAADAQSNLERSLTSRVVGKLGHQ